jgi:hypothetical protein
MKLSIIILSLIIGALAIICLIVFFNVPQSDIKQGMENDSATPTKVETKTPHVSKTETSIKYKKALIEADKNQGVLMPPNSQKKEGSFNKIESTDNKKTTQPTLKAKGNLPKVQNENKAQQTIKGE